MADVQLTFEAVDKHIAAANLAPFKKGGKGHFNAKSVASTPSDVLQKLCGIWKIVGPIVKLVVKAPLPGKWKHALKILIGLMDTVCQGT